MNTISSLHNYVKICHPCCIISVYYPLLQHGNLKYNIQYDEFTVFVLNTQILQMLNGNKMKTKNISLTAGVFHYSGVTLELIGHSV